MKSPRLTLIALILCVAYTSTSHSGRKVGVKLVPMPAGHSVANLASAISGNTIVVGVPEMGLATIYVDDRGDGQKWKMQQELQMAGELVGWSVAISRDTVLVGAPDTAETGRAFIFVRKGNTWNQTAKLGAPDPENKDLFAQDVSLDRNTAIIGVPKDDDAGKDSGSAYIFFRKGQTWKQQAKLIASDAGKGDTFGTAVFVHGNTAVVGANGATHSGKRYAGAAYVFVRNGNTWTEQAKLTASDAGKADRFGSDVTMHGKTIIVGAPFLDSENKGDSGAAYIYVMDGNTWKQQAKLTPKDSQKGHKFGTGMAVTPNIAIIGAPFDNSEEVGGGAAYSFVRVDGIWTEQAKVSPKDVDEDFHFGKSINIHLNTVVISAHHIPHFAETWPHGDGVQAYVFNTTRDFNTPPFAVDPSGLRKTTLAQVKQTALYQNFPNPFNPETWLPYRLASDAPVRFLIYDVQGQLTRELDLGPQKAADYLTRETAAYWDGKSQFGETVSSGIYFFTLQAGLFQTTRRMLILK